jgi:DNA-binding PucR family transcriptional regulator
MTAVRFYIKTDLSAFFICWKTRKQEDIIAAVDAFLTDTQYQVGISDVYRGLLNSNTAYLQASIALSMGLQYNISNTHFCFRDYAMRHFFMNGVSALPPLLYCEDDVRKLAACKNSKVDYYTTLKVYLENNMNLLHTAEKLFIHRTTLYCRLKYIEKIISADINDSEARFRLLLSFKLMEMDPSNHPEQTGE